MRGERGSASVVAVAVVAVAMVLGLGAADTARVLAAAARAQAAADAAALAAAQELALPSDRAPVELADEFAARNGAELLECRCEPGTFDVYVRVRVPVGTLLLLGSNRVVDAEAAAIVDTGSG
ncbi:MAG TPA: Rv3654c family TadE-like protein [Actinomycetota bacterium]|nr:Rv3654c family TadE-like protein [Actinomycetota bacterium]